MKILIDGLSKDTGGIGTLVMNIADYNLTQKSKLELVFLVPEESVYISRLEKDGYRYYIVPSLTNIFKYLKVIKSILKNEKFDYVWINNSSKVNLFILKYSVKFSNAKVITHTHGVDMEEQGLKRLIFKTIEKINEKSFYNYISIPLACSEASADAFYKNQELRRRAVVIKNGIFTKKYMFSEEKRNKIRKLLNIKQDDILLGSVGRISEVKNFKFIVNVLSKCENNFKLVILGDGPEKEELIKLVDELKLENRVFLQGNVDNVCDYLCAMDMFVMPSLHEGMPFSIIEAQASGLPCLVSDTVSRDVNLTNRVEFLELNNIDEWTNYLNNYQFGCYNRLVDNDIIVKQGYSIENDYHVLLNEIAKTERRN